METILTHRFENAGLGKWPYRFQGVDDPGRGSSCDYCGTGIRFQFWFRSADGKRFKTGCDCFYKAFEGLESTTVYRQVQKAERQAKAAAAEKSKAEKAKRDREARREAARQTLEAAGLARAWQIFTAVETANWRYEEPTIYDLVAKLVQFGSISDKQTELLRKLVRQVEARGEAPAGSEPFPVTTERVTVRGRVLSMKWHQSRFPAMKMLVQTDAGWKAYGTRPEGLDNDDAALSLHVGDTVEFVATLEPSRDDKSFGFFSRPATARIIERVPR